MQILVNGTTVSEYQEGVEGVPFEVDDFPGFQDGKILHWDGLEWWYEDDVASPEEVLSAIFTATPETMKAIPDDTLSRMAAYMQQWSSDASYSTGDLRQYNGFPYRCLQSHDANETWTPSDAPSLWARVLAGQGDIIPVWGQPDSTNAYMTGDRVHYPDIDGPVYESLIDNNIWSPEAYPSGWQLVQ